MQSSGSACPNTTPRIISKKKACRGNSIIDQLGLEHDQSWDQQLISVPEQLPCLFEFEDHVAHEGVEVAKSSQLHQQQGLK